MQITEKDKLERERESLIQEREFIRARMKALEGNRRRGMVWIRSRYSYILTRMVYEIDRINQEIETEEAWERIKAAKERRGKHVRRDQDFTEEGTGRLPGNYGWYETDHRIRSARIIP